MTSSVVMQEEQGQAPVEHSDATQRVTGRSNNTEKRIGGASGGNVEKADQKVDSGHSIENRNFYETEEEKCQFMCTSGC